MLERISDFTPYILTYPLCATLAHKAATNEDQSCRFFARRLSSCQVFPIPCASASRVGLQVILGRPLFLLPSGVQRSATLAMLLSLLLRFLLLITPCLGIYIVQNFLKHIRLHSEEILEIPPGTHSSVPASVYHNGPNRPITAARASPTIAGGLFDVCWGAALQQGLQPPAPPVTTIRLWAAARSRQAWTFLEGWVPLSLLSTLSPWYEVGSWILQYIYPPHQESRGWHWHLTMISGLCVTGTVIAGMDK